MKNTSIQFPPHTHHTVWSLLRWLSVSIAIILISRHIRRCFHSSRLFFTPYKAVSLVGLPLIYLPSLRQNWGFFLTWIFLSTFFFPLSENCDMCRYSCNFTVKLQSSSVANKIHTSATLNSKASRVTCVDLPVLTWDHHCPHSWSLTPYIKDVTFQSFHLWFSTVPINHICDH